MTPENFCYWLQGWLEIETAGMTKVPMMTDTKVKVIQDHLKLVFEKRTPEHNPFEKFFTPGYCANAEPMLIC